MLKKTHLLALLFISLSIYSCKKDDSTDTNGEWERVSDFEGVPRSGAFTFTIDNKAYVGAGYDGTNRLNDFWMFDPTLNNWYKMTSFPGSNRMNSVGFSINGIGYAGTGTDGDKALSDFYAYNPTANSWTKIADFPGDARYGAVAFALNGKGYVGCGTDLNSYKDFYAYDPSTNTWTQTTSIPGAKRLNAFAFVIGNKAYVGGGLNNGLYNTDFFSYDATTDQWTQLEDLTRTGDYTYTLGRQAASTFTIGNYGYLALGNNGSSLGDLWRYNPSGDYWEVMDTFEGSTRSEAVGFGLNGIGYIATGRTGSVRFDDCWKYDPEAVDTDE